MGNQKAKKTTLADIAAATGYSVNTISHALKNKADIAAATRERIQQIAGEMGYVRNEAARSLRSGKTKTLGVIVGGMYNPFYAWMTDEIQDAAAEMGYSLLIFCSRDEQETEQRVLEAAISRQVDGILLFPCHGSQKSVDRLKAVGVPYVLMSRCIRPGQDDCVICNEEQGGYLATRHLIENGRTPAFLGSHEVLYSSEQRFRGFLRACVEAGIAEEACRHAICSDNETLMQQVLEWKSQGVDGLFMFCDLEAWNMTVLMHQHGLQIPNDFALVGFDNIQECWKLPSPLCTIGWDGHEMVKQALQLLHRRIRGESFAPQTIIFEPYMVCRNSCGKMHSKG